VIGLLLTRWRFSLTLTAALAFLGLALAANHYRHAYHAEKALRKAQEAAYVAAQAIAAQKAQAALVAAETAYRSKANEADQAFQSKLADARRLADAYVSLHRVRAASGRAASGTVASAESDRAGSPDRADQATDMVAVTASDIQVCTDNTLRLEAAREWALSLTK